MLMPDEKLILFMRFWHGFPPHFYLIDCLAAWISAWFPSKYALHLFIHSSQDLR